MSLKDFNQRFWENVLERRFLCCDVEITSFIYTPDGFVSGNFTAFSRLIDGVERYYSFTCDGCSIDYTLILK